MDFGDESTLLKRALRLPDSPNRLIVSRSLWSCSCMSWARMLESRRNLRILTTSEWSVRLFWTMDWHDSTYFYILVWASRKFVFHAILCLIKVLYSESIIAAFSLNSFLVKLSISYLAPNTNLSSSILN